MYVYPLAAAQALDFFFAALLIHTTIHTRIPADASAHDANKSAPLLVV